MGAATATAALLPPAGRSLGYTELYASLHALLHGQGYALTNAGALALGNGQTGTDIITVATEITANSFYQTPDGWKEIEERKEEIRVKGEKPVPFTARWTRWGPVIEGPKDGRALVLRWTAHDAEATNLEFIAMETVRTAAEGVTSEEISADVVFVAVPPAALSEVAAGEEEAAAP